MAQGRKTGGRIAGTPNKVTSTLSDAVEAEVGAPLPVLLARIGIRAMKVGDDALAVNAFSKAAAYIYPRLQAMPPPAPPIPPIEITFSDGKPCTACGHDPYEHGRAHP